MNRSQQVIEVFHELRRSVDGRVSAHDILAAAASIVELMQEEDDGPGFDFRVGGTPFENWAIDVALADGGWRVMWHEMQGGAPWMHEDSYGMDCRSHDALMKMGAYE